MSANTSNQSSSQSSSQPANQLAGQRAFITGGASGIGAEMARRFTREGAMVVVADVNDSLGKQIAVEVGGEYVHRLTSVG